MVTTSGTRHSTCADTGNEEMTELKSIRLADGYKNKWMMLVGDGLTQMRVKSFTEMIQNASFDVGEQQKITETIRKAMGQVVSVTGDLHGGMFHFLSASYTLFYAALIQPIQCLLGWKRLCGTDVTKCYQQAAGLSNMIAVEIERQMLGAYLVYISSDEERIRPYVEASTDDREETREALAVKLAAGFTLCLHERRSKTTDDVFRLALDFLEITNLYSHFQNSLSNPGMNSILKYMLKSILKSIFSIHFEIHFKIHV